MNQSFKMDFQGLEFVLRKNDVDFSRGLGVIKATFNVVCDGDVVNEELIGVVDKNYETVLELTPLSYIRKLCVIDEANVVFNTYDFELFHTVVTPEGNIYTYLIEGFDFVYLGADILRISDGKVKSLFNIKTNTFISSDFSYIGDFEYQEEYQEKLAEAWLFIDIDGSNYEQVITYLDEEGQVATSYYAVNSNMFFDKSMATSEVIELVKGELGLKR